LEARQFVGVGGSHFRCISQAYQYFVGASAQSAYQRHYAEKLLLSRGTDILEDMHAITRTLRGDVNERFLRLYLQM